MKQIFGGAFVVVFVGWLLYAAFAEQPCERIYRGAAPVRIAFDAVRWGGHNFLTQDSRLRLISWSISADGVTQKFLGRLFYGPSLDCRQ
ncbi:hypothetical protein BSFA1_82110 (plasmid) [Burkholderia sp. SFA1]|uniref:Uncharacterized protein n=1 Tax=Burkholderia vietnamiensis (strain G4 / LMG 22486) TaxID=269482 RepID=A4JTN1_BURVG|nr:MULTISPECIES: hypothetical protein [Caballeronia]ABO59634.1 hypothetical protein Bcep1808_6746 [Burkholderia vietnamiensis G4]AET95500.1 hypothetical protein BYI23_E003390 [Burkholderia sp. YI23]MCB4350206.1 hypothetical protein [Burkholderia vietnamiensis]BBQ03083.1 hypothetical protein BSFA1_82110 [Burkholderia sp. SFA1]MDR5799259.1 hypothetical protein [Caballeronia sp. LZ001]